MHALRGVARLQGMLKRRRPETLRCMRDMQLPCVIYRGWSSKPTDGGGEGERDAEPEEAAQEVAAHGGRRPRCDGALPVRLVDEDGAKGADDLEGMHRRA